MVFVEAILARPRAEDLPWRCNRFAEKVGYHFRAVNTLPVEQMKREFIELIPGNFLGHEKIDTGFPENLRQGGGITEHIGKP